MQLQRLTGLERQKILDELAELLKLIERLLAILSSDKLVMQIVVEELRKVQDKYRDARRTEILAEEGEFRIEDLIAEEDMLPTTLQMAMLLAPLRLLSRKAASVSAVSPDWVMTIASALPETIGFRYRYSEP